VQLHLKQLQLLKAAVAGLRNDHKELLKEAHNKSGKGAGTQRRLQQRLRATQAGGSSSAGAAAGTASGTAASATMTQTAPGTATTAATARDGRNGWVSKQGEQLTAAAGDGDTLLSLAATDAAAEQAAAAAESLTPPLAAAALSDASSAKASELRHCGELLQALGSRVWSLLPQRYACNNPACANLAGVSEGLLVAGRGCVCGRCRVARWAVCVCACVPALCAASALWNGVTTCRTLTSVVWDSHPASTELPTDECSKLPHCCTVEYVSGISTVWAWSCC
jgi:hypothetical protein